MESIENSRWTRYPPWGTFAPFCHSSVGHLRADIDTGIMDLHQLEHFVAIVEEGSITKAAARLHFAQSSLSSSLRSLENELGAPLFTRRRSGMSLTDPGAALLPAARRVLGELEQAREAVAAARGRLRATVRVASIPATHRIDLCQVLSDYRAAHGDVVVHLQYGSASQMVRAVAAGAVDFAVTPPVAAMPSDVEFRGLLELPLVLICPRDHPLAGRDNVTPREIRQSELLDLSASWAARQLFDRYLGDPGRVCRIELDSWEDMMAMVERGMGIGYSPTGLMKTEHHAGLSFVTLHGAPRWELGIATKGQGPTGRASRALMGAFHECLARST
jgi:DNA-binding transcriptional LysR family regulator